MESKELKAWIASQRSADPALDKNLTTTAAAVLLCCNRTTLLGYLRDKFPVPKSVARIAELTDDNIQLRKELREYQRLEALSLGKPRSGSPGLSPLDKKFSVALSGLRTATKSLEKLRADLKAHNEPVVYEDTDE